MVKGLPEFEYFTVFLKNRKFISKIRISKVTDYAALNRIHRPTRKCMFDTFTPKCTGDYTAVYTSLTTNVKHFNNPGQHLTSNIIS